ncbi:sulfite oxidase [Streptomyces sp. ODS28]|uniref:sulfite oxidase n=1 Tax=Streptomyces sp. ODS28 TaxID=3136688 RepID=UPI0031EB3325
MSAWGKRPGMRIHEREPLNAEPPAAALAERAITPLDAFYVRNHGPVPEASDGWRLTVDGLVERELELTPEELRDRFPEHEVLATLECAGNRRTGLTAVHAIPGEAAWGPGAVSTARWTGVRLADVLAAAGLRPGTAHIAFAAPDRAPGANPPQPYGGSVPVGKALGGEVLLAWGMNGQPLPAVHGAPLRAVVPGWIGARSVKWLRRVTAQVTPSDNYFQTTAYRLLPPGADPECAAPGEGITLGPLALNCALLQPDGSAPLPPGTTRVTGYALAEDCRDVVRVEVSADGGATWAPAAFEGPAEPWSWRRWHADVLLYEGETELVARAWDATGAVQPETAECVWNPKGYVNTSWPRVRVRCVR